MNVNFAELLRSMNKYYCENDDKSRDTRVVLVAAMIALSPGAPQGPISSTTGMHYHQLRRTPYSRVVFSLIP
jgi:hypothetical protein